MINLVVTNKGKTVICRENPYRCSGNFMTNDLTLMVKVD